MATAVRDNECELRVALIDTYFAKSLFQASVLSYTMSSLSDLLNPAPSSEAAAPPKAQQLAPLQLDGQDHRSHGYESGYSHAQSPVRPTVTSPGLDVLAAAASSTAPLFSPTRQHSSVAQAMDQSSSQSSLRTDGILPEVQAVSHSNQKQLNSGYQQSHHPSSDRDHLIEDYSEDMAKSIHPSHQPLAPQNGDSTMGKVKVKFSLLR